MSTSCEPCRSAVGKEPPAQQRNPHRREKVSDDLRHRGQVHVRALGRRIPFHDESLVVVDACRRASCVVMPVCVTPGNALRRRSSSRLNVIDLRLLCILLLRQPIGGRGHVFRPVAEIHRPHLLKAAQQQARRREQHQGNRNLRHHQRRTQARVSSALRAAPCRLLSGSRSHWCAARQMPEPARTPGP